ncbi:MAG: DedA family protein, partial [Muribaculaceae bacterium]|nr:DedA family protein [Muribaculaceae bacterium]
CLINREKVDKAERYFDEHGAASTFIGRLIPAVRQLISIPAGLAKMNIVKFIVFTSLGAVVWNGILGALGYWLGRTVPLQALQSTIEKYNGYLSIAGVVLLLVCVAYVVYKSVKKHEVTK